MLALICAVLVLTAIVSSLAQGQPLPMKDLLALTFVTVALLAIFITGMAALDWATKKLTLRLRRPSSVSFDSIEIRYSVPRKGIERLPWDSLARVLVITTDEGPFAEDMFWVLVPRAGKGLVIANGAQGTSSLMGEMASRLVGFDHHAVVKSAGSTTNAIFEIWRAPDATAPPV
jgi:hypothetical protein